MHRNTSEHRRIWPGLTNAATGTTLELGPGEKAEVVGLLEDMFDHHLKPVKAHKPKHKNDNDQPGNQPEENDA